ncbi:SMI1/KNR4 family protein [Luteolibacter sp. Populi]|uniref:SMI1/KNR4 family protein n=1 Tax=Luteolibacter sp. Populi TaxID=3230487 RepID=UPI003466315A
MKPAEHIEDSGSALDAAALDGVEKELAVKLPGELRSLLLATNGGEFSYKVNATFRFKEMELEIRGFCRVETDHVEDLASVAQALSDRLDYRKHLPVAYDGGGNYLVMGIKCNSIYFWDHEGGPLVKVARSLTDFVAGIEFEPSESPFEILCQSASLEEMKIWQGFNEERDTLCQQAARQGNLRLVRECIAAQLPEGKVMRFAAMNGHWGIVDFLLGLGRDINAVDETGKTLLDWVQWKPPYVAEVERRGGVSGT